MGMTVKQTGALPKAVWDEKSSKTLSEAALKQIITRAFKEGEGLNDSGLKPYSKEYADWRAKHGLSRTPDLTVTGAMKSSISVADASKDGFSIGSSSPYLDHVNRDRPFFGLSEKDMSRLKDDIEKAIEAAMERSSK